LRFRKDTLFDDIRGQWFWQRTAQGWQASVPEIRFDKGGGSERISDVRVTADAGRWAAQAQTVALNPFTVIMPLAKGQLPDVDAWLNRAGIQGQISAVTTSAAGAVQAMVMPSASNRSARRLAFRVSPGY
jgi:uncharacterized protein YhdP